MSQQSPDAEMTGRSLGAYRIKGLIGAGGMGQVYLAEHELLKHTAAIKVLLPSLSEHAVTLERFFREAMLMAKLKHPGLVEVFDFGTEDDGTSFLVMEMLDGETLTSRLRRHSRLAPEQVALWGSQIAGALDETHRQGIIHRDLKPSNVFIIADDDVAGGERTKLLDFGIAKLVQGDDVDDVDDQLTATGTVVGTPVFMSPEQCRGQRELTGASDMYSLGCVLYSMLAGRPPFVCEGLGSYIVAHCTTEPPRLPKFAQASSALESLVHRMMAKDADDRPTAAEARRELEKMNPRGDAGQWQPVPGEDGPTEIDVLTAGTVSDKGKIASASASVGGLLSTIHTDGSLGPSSIAAAETTPHSRPASHPFAVAGQPRPSNASAHESPQPMSPRRRRNLAIGLSAAAVATVGIAVLAISADSASNVALDTTADASAEGVADAPTIATAPPLEPVEPVDAATDAPTRPLDAGPDAVSALIRVVIESSPEDADVRKSPRGKSLGKTPLVLEVTQKELPLTVWLTKTRHKAKKVVVTADRKKTFRLTRKSRSKPDPLEEM